MSGSVPDRDDFGGYPVTGIWLRSVKNDGEKTSLADSITNIGWRKWQYRIQTEFLRTTGGANGSVKTAPLRS